MTCYSNYEISCWAIPEDCYHVCKTKLSQRHFQKEINNSNNGLQDKWTSQFDFWKTFLCVSAQIWADFNIFHRKISDAEKNSHSPIMAPSLPITTAERPKFVTESNNSAQNPNFKVYVQVQVQNIHVYLQDRD